MQTEKNNKPKESELSKAISKLNRRERYEKERDQKNGLLFYSSDSDYAFASASYKQWECEENEKKSFQALYKALEDLKRIDPAGHRLIVEYYLSEEKVTKTEIGARHGISRQACGQKIKRSLKKLKMLVKMYR